MKVCVMEVPEEGQRKEARHEHHRQTVNQHFMNKEAQILNKIQLG